MVGSGGSVRVKVGVQVGVQVENSVVVRVGTGVGESSEGVLMAVGVLGCQVGEEIGVMVGVGVGAEVEVVMLFPSASESEKPPSSKPIEARAMIIPKNTCHKFFTAGSLRATLPRPASGH